MKPMTALRDESDVDAALDSDLALLYKHSPLCGLSTMARREVERFARAHPGVPVFTVDVIHARALSMLIEERLGIRHESPQVILLRAGTPTFDASHWGVKLDAIERALAA